MAQPMLRWPSIEGMLKPRADNLATLRLAAALAFASWTLVERPASRLSPSAGI